MRQNKWPSQYFNYNFFSFWSLEPTLFPKDAPSNSLQNHNQTNFCGKLRKKLNEDYPTHKKCSTFKASVYPMNGLCFYLLFSSSSRSILKAKYTIRCSLKSSTSYIKNLISYLFSKWTKFCPTNFRCCEKAIYWSHGILLLFKRKRCIHIINFSL